MEFIKFGIWIFLAFTIGSIVVGLVCWLIFGGFALVIVGISWVWEKIRNLFR